MSELNGDLKTKVPWLNRTVWGMAITSFLSDLGHEAQSTLLPGFMAALGLPPVALGAVEGLADASASFMKLAAGWFSDRIGRRKGLVVGGYWATGLASGFIAMAAGWPLILFGKFFGWLGRGLRGPCGTRSSRIASLPMPEGGPSGSIAPETPSGRSSGHWRQYWCLDGARPMAWPRCPSSAASWPGPLSLVCLLALHSPSL